MPTITATPDPTTGSVLIQAEQTILRDLYTRVVANGWGNATTGQAWTLGGGVAAEYSVNGTQGLMAFSGTASRRMSAPMASTDMGYSTTVSIGVVPLTQPILPGIMIRHIDGNNYYMAELTINTTNVVELRIRKMVLGVTTTIAGPITLGQTHAAAAIWNIKAEICGNTITAKAWRSTVAEPDWLLTVNDFDITTGTNAGARSIIASGNTNGTVTFTYDNAYAYVSQPIRIFRVTPDGVETEVRGSPLNTNAPTAAANTATATLWDNESPFDVDLFYRMYSNCNLTTVIADSAVIVLDSDGFGWLRDPTNPTRNIAITMEEFFDECVDQDVVVFSGLGNPEYASASGVFGIIDAMRPRTVSQTRKNYASRLALTSFSLDDILSLEDIYAPGTILSLTLPMVYGWALRSFGTDYITIGNIQQSYIGVDQRVSSRTWDIPFQLSGPPVDTSTGGTGGNGIGGGGATYDDLAASALGLTYNVLTASLETYDQVAAGVGY